MYQPALNQSSCNELSFVEVTNNLSQVSNRTRNTRLFLSMSVCKFSALSRNMSEALKVVSVTVKKVPISVGLTLLHAQDKC